MKRPSRVAAGAVAAGAAVLASLVLFLWPGGSSAPVPAASMAGPAPAAPRTLRGTTRGEDGPLGPDADREKMVSHLRSRYGAHIHEPYVQIKLLESLIGHFRARDPEGWEQAVLDLVRAAFPDRYAEIAANLRRWLDYERWAAGRRDELKGLDEKQRRAAVWEERKRLFGDATARNIWASELKGEAFADALRAIDSQGGTVSEKLARYQESIEDIYQERAGDFTERRQQELMDHFLNLESVQQELSAGSPEQRTRSLREIREGLGLSEEAIQRWAALDEQRDARWEVGARYMREREALAKQFTGADLEARLKELRSRLFGGEAAVIEQEEQSGFFRFSRPRRWGRN